MLSDSLIDNSLGILPDSSRAKNALITLSEWRSCGVVITKFSGHVVTLRSSPTVFADTPMLWSTSTRIAAGKPPRATWNAAMLLGLYRIWAHSWCTRLLTAANLIKTKAVPGHFEA
jgi:hypothetical protein